ncbi:hypothetical protein D3C81_496590 [compost metagenome]
MLQEKINQGDLVVYMNPRHPLPTIANRPAQPQFERQAQARQKAALARQHQAGTHQYHTNTQRLGSHGGFFPGDAQLAGKILLDRLRGFGELTLATIAIPTYRRARNQHLRALLARLQPGQQLFGQGDPTGPEQCPSTGTPGPIGYRCTGQIDHRIHGVVIGQLVKPGNAAHASTT